MCVSGCSDSRSMLFVTGECIYILIFCTSFFGTFIQRKLVKIKYFYNKYFCTWRMLWKGVHSVLRNICVHFYNNSSNVESLNVLKIFYGCDVYTHIIWSLIYIRIRYLWQYKVWYRWCFYRFIVFRILWMTPKVIT